MNFHGILASQKGCIPISCTKGGPLDYPDIGPQQDFQIRIQHQFQYHWLILGHQGLGYFNLDMSNCIKFR